MVQSWLGKFYHRRRNSKSLIDTSFTAIPSRTRLFISLGVCVLGATGLMVSDGDYLEKTVPPPKKLMENNTSQEFILQIQPHGLTKAVSGPYISRSMEALFTKTEDRIEGIGREYFCLPDDKIPKIPAAPKQMATCTSLNWYPLPPTCNPSARIWNIPEFRTSHSCSTKCNT